MRLYNTLTRSLEVLNTDKDQFSVYACGPTVYDVPHLGHARQVLIHDIMRRHLKASGVNVKFVSNITDVDDKIINKAAALGVGFKEITSKYETSWNEMLDVLNVLAPDEAPHATDFITSMVSKIEKMIELSHAYVGETGVWFDTSSVEPFVSLSPQVDDSRRSGARVEVVSDKRNPEDFVLWKFTSDPAWDSPWGRGRPGWHTECVAMSLEIFGPVMDLHAGGLDLMFPHHDNERRQAAALGAPFASHWMHHAFVERDGAKMGKSEGNALNLKDALKEYDPRSLRLMVLMSHYRSPLNVTVNNLQAASNTLRNLDELTGYAPRSDRFDEGWFDSLVSFLDEDLDTVSFMREVLVESKRLHRQFNNTEVDEPKLEALLRALEHVGLNLQVPHRLEVPVAVEELANARALARESKNWVEADALRDSIVSLGWGVKDTPGGFELFQL